MSFEAFYSSIVNCVKFGAFNQTFESPLDQKNFIDIEEELKLVTDEFIKS